MNLAQMDAHVVTTGERAQTYWTLGLARVQILVQGQRHRMLEALPADTAAETELSVWKITREREDHMLDAFI